MNEAMIRFNLINGDSYTWFGDEAIKTYHRISAGLQDEAVAIKHDDKTVMITLRHIVSIEWRGVE